MTIYLAGNLISNIEFSGFGHLQLVKDGYEFEVQAPVPWLTLGYWQFPGERPHFVPSGATIGDPATYSSKALLLDDGISEDGVWSIFSQANSVLSNYILEYDVFFNSNSYANTLLKLIGLSAKDFVTYPTKVSSYPGMNADAAQGWGVEWDILGLDGGDKLKGGWDNDKFQGGNGTDFLYGAAGADRLYGGSEASPVDSAADYLYGGPGQDTFFVGNDLGASIAFPRGGSGGDRHFNEAVRGSYDVIMDYSKFDKIDITITNYWGYTKNLSISSYNLSPSYTFGDKETYWVGAVNGVGVSVYRDSYFDENLSETISVVVFMESELKWLGLSEQCRAFR